MGGSLPKYEDLLVLKNILNIDSNYIKLVNYTGIKLQTVLNSNKGKNPGDFMKLNRENLFAILKKLVQ